MVLGKPKVSSARDTSYLNFSEHFVWDKTKREWKELVKEFGSIIGRVYSSHPGEGERDFI